MPRCTPPPPTRRRPSMAPGLDPSIARAVEAWFALSARDLPWRPRSAPRNAYHALVSEAMLQQTQVSRVVERFREFIDRFPTVQDLAAADEADVLGLWSGLGYYRRARSLHAAARAIVAEHGGRVPSSAEALLRLPGIGRYTAGAIASIAYGERAPIVDGNVARVLMRLHNRRGRSADPGDPAAQRWTWRRAEELVAAAPSPGAFNEGLMELGATVCTPRTPSCAACPLRSACDARAAGTQAQIPRPKPAARTREIYGASVLATTRDEDGERLVLVEQRPDRSGTGGASGAMWAGLWQAPTLERTDRAPTRGEVARFIGVPARDLAPASSFIHKTSHRVVRFDVWVVNQDGCERLRTAPGRGRWRRTREVEKLGLSNPQRRILIGATPGALTPRSATAPAPAGPAREDGRRSAR